MRYSNQNKLNVIFVHGWGCGCQDWRSVKPLLFDRIRPGFVDLLSIIDCSAMHGLRNLSEAAEQVIFFADEIGFERFALVGHSMGARIAADIAAHHTERVSRLLLLDGSNLPEDPEIAEERLSNEIKRLGQEKWAELTINSMMVENLETDLKLSMVKRLANYPIQVLLDYYYAMAKWDRDQFLPAINKIECPVTIMQATTLDSSEKRHSVISNPSSRWIDGFSTYIPKSKIVLLPGTGHFVMLEHPKAISDWVNKNESFLNTNPLTSKISN